MPEIQIVREEEYIPECNGNREEKNPVKVHIHYLTPAEDSQTYKIVNGKPARDQEVYFAMMIPTVENLTAKDETGHTQEITNGAELCGTPGLDDYYYDILTHINKKTGIDSKN